MQTQFRFPKTTAVLMIIILVGVVWAIEKGQAIEAAYSVGMPAGPIPPVESLLPGIAEGRALFYVSGLIGWSILFALRRSGMHRLDRISSEQK